MRQRLSEKVSRRKFVGAACAAVAALPVVPFFIKRSQEKFSATAPRREEGCEWCGPANAPQNPPARIIIPPPGEPGEPLVISGTVYKEDGGTPAAGVIVYAYHTNAAGIYPQRTPDDGTAQWRHGYLRGWMKTGADGCYEFRTIRPGGYPGSPDPAHVHMTVRGPGYPEFWIDGLWFEGDSRITPQMRQRLTNRGGFAPVINLTRDAGGVWRGVRDIRLEHRPG